MKQLFNKSMERQMSLVEGNHSLDFTGHDGIRKAHVGRS